MKPKEPTDPKRTKTINDEIIVIEEEIKMPFESGVGSLIGEIAMMDPTKGSRALSGMAKIDSIFLLLNHDAFDILVKEKQKKINESLTALIFDAIPKMNDLYKKIVKNVHLTFKEMSYVRNTEIIKEGERSEIIYILKQG